METLNLLKSKSLTAAVKDEISSLILSGQLAAGQKLTEYELAERLGVSRGPVREALLGLEEAGLIRLAKNRGMYVREISVEEAGDLYEVRAGLEGWAGRILAPKITEEQVAELRSLVSEMADSIVRNDLNAYFRQNIRFHEVIVEMTGNAKLVMLYRRIVNEMHLIRRHELAASGMRRSVEEHANIVRALETRSGERAAAAMEAHVLGGRERFLTMAEK
ncbi:MAG TPA: FCD domain-containing protein [Pseudolabrys sp.]|nr:FCD domain-containing protein [Pseudolabrys sp.]